MKIGKLLLAAIVMLTTIVAAGGFGKDLVVVEDIPVIQITEEPQVYLLAGYTVMNYSTDKPDTSTHAKSGVTIGAGYSMFKYMNIEGVYSRSIADLGYSSGVLGSTSGQYIESFGAFVKPKYKYKSIVAYGTLGYGITSLHGDEQYSEASLQWGLGLGVVITDTVGLQLDYKRLYDDTGFDGLRENSPTAVNAITLGLLYKL